MIEHVTVTQARNFMPIFDMAVRGDRLVKITRHKRDEAVLLSRPQLLRLLESFTFHVNVIPEPDGGFTLAVRELNIAEDGDSLLDARRNLLDGVRSYVRHYITLWDMYKHMPDMRAQEPYIMRLSLAESDNELISMLFGPAQRHDTLPDAGP
jgi:hypothetical protein